MTHDPNAEFYTLNQEQQDYVIRTVAKVKERGPTADMQTSYLPDGTEVAASPGHQGTNWWVNRGTDGFNLARGIWPETAS